MSEIAKIFGMTRQAVSARVRKMESKGVEFPNRTKPKRDSRKESKDIDER